jgi:ABC-type bacteriocin/lantibiotic exporter with double-glycine peptidase domain
MPATLPVPLHRQQSEGDCLPVCIEMVLGYWGLPVSYQDLTRQLGTDPNVGTPASRALRLQSSTLSVEYSQADEAKLRDYLAQHVPVVMLVDTAELPYWSRRAAHSVVLVGVEGSMAYVNDPAFDIAPLSVNLGDLLLASDAMSNLVIIIMPTYR